MTGACSTVKVEPLSAESSAREPEALVDHLIALGQSVLDEQGLSWENISRVGVACPGQVDRETGVVVGASNLPSWKNVPLAGLVQERTGKPVTVMNDACAAAAAEIAVRHSPDTIAVLTLGTGVGLGVICSGRIMTGSRGLIEGGHMIVEPGPNARPCACGQRGCLEAYASATAVAAIYSERMKYDAEMKRVATPKASVRNGGDSLPAAPSPPIRTRRAIKVRRASTSAVATRILELERKSSGGEAVFAPGNFPPQVASSDKEEGGDAQTVEHGGPSPLAETSYASSESSAEVNGDVGAITAEEVFARARRGDEVAIGVVEATCDYLALACLNICRTLDPAAILLTGGLARAEGLVGKVREAFAKRGWKILPHVCEINLASTCESSSSGILGAAGAAASDYARKDHCSDSINRGEGRDLLSDEAKDDAGETHPANVSEGYAMAESEGRGNGVATLESAAGLERALQPRGSSALSPEGLDAALEGKRGIAGDIGRVLIGMGIGVCLGVGLCYGVGVNSSARGRRISAEAR
ncbi:unnamed protein product [Ascophyllum nodosum]